MPDRAETDTFEPQVTGMFRQGLELHPVNGAELDDSLPFEGLTAKQSQFCRAVFSGMSYADAYRQVYDCSGMSMEVSARKAKEEASSPLVSGKLRQLRLEADDRATLAPTLSADWVLAGIQNLAVNADTDAVRLAAYVHLGKSRLINLFGTDKSGPERKARTAEDVERELRKFIDELPQIEGTARDVTPARPRAQTAPGRSRRAARKR